MTEITNSAAYHRAKFDTWSGTRTRDLLPYQAQGRILQHKKQFELFQMEQPDAMQHMRAFYDRWIDERGYNCQFQRSDILRQIWHHSYHSEQPLDIIDFRRLCSLFAMEAVPELSVAGIQKHPVAFAQLETSAPHPSRQHMVFSLDYRLTPGYDGSAIQVDAKTKADGWLRIGHLDSRQVPPVSEGDSYRVTGAVKCGLKSLKPVSFRMVLDIEDMVRTLEQQKLPVLTETDLTFTQMTLNDFGL